MKYVYREVKCPWCGHIFMWKKYEREGCCIVEYIFKPTGEYVEETKCPKCSEHMFVVDDIFIGLDKNDNRIALDGFVEPSLEEINQYIDVVRSGKK